MNRTLHGHILLEQHDVCMFGPPHGLAVLAKALKGTLVQHCEYYSTGRRFVKKKGTRTGMQTCIADVSFR